MTSFWLMFINVVGHTADVTYEHAEYFPLNKTTANYLNRHPPYLVSRW